MAKRFRHEDVSAVPSGWKVRTVKHSDHRVRVAFPPGRKQNGAGRLVSILHPAGENPCTMRSANPAELMIMGANPPRRRGAHSYRVVAVSRHGNPSLSHDFETQKEAHEFRRKVNPHEYFSAHIQKIRKSPEGVSSNPRVEVVHGENPPVEEIVEGFSGTQAEWVDVYNEPHIPRGRYAQLGELLNLYIKPAKGGQVQKITFGTGAAAPIVICDSTARQIYFVGGDQDISAALPMFVAGSEAGTVRLGEGRRIDYKAKKEHVAEPDEDKWKHDHGEENGALPTVLFDTRNKKLLYEGGDYRIDGAWIRN